jgi:hypothetical protein
MHCRITSEVSFIERRTSPMVASARRYSTAKTRETAKSPFPTVVVVCPWLRRQIPLIPVFSIRRKANGDHMA